MPHAPAQPHAQSHAIAHSHAQSHAGLRSVLTGSLTKAPVNVSPGAAFIDMVMSCGGKRRALSEWADNKGCSFPVFN